MIFGYFDKACCINLKERTDRRRHASAQFRRLRLPRVEFVNAVAPPDEGVFRTKGTHGCALSHRSLFMKAKMERLNSLAIFEDDVVFRDDFATAIGPIVEDLRSVVWDVFYFFRPRKGANDLDGDRGDILQTRASGLVRTTGSTLTHAYAIHSRCVDVLLEKTDPAYLRDHTPFEIRAIDKAIAHLHLKCYACASDLTYQEPALLSSIEVATPPP